MSSPKQFSRRRFMQVCGSFAAFISGHARVLAKQGGQVRRYNRVSLVDRHGQPLRSSQLETGGSYIFHYPFVATPCFLLDLGAPVAGGESLETEDGDVYRWRGGVGPNRSVVAFSAICSHKMTHPSRQVSFINYRPGETEFINSEEQRRERDQIIYCCSEKSVYDVTRGARVLGGPAPQPLASIALDYDADTDHIYATGTYGGEMFNQFLSNFAQRLSLEYGTTDIDEQVAGYSTVLPMEEFCTKQVLC